VGRDPGASRQVKACFGPADIGRHCRTCVGIAYRDLSIAGDGRREINSAPLLSGELTAPCDWPDSKSALQISKREFQLERAFPSCLSNRVVEGRLEILLRAPDQVAEYNKESHRELRDHLYAGLLG
jgi:hypothetical protein